MRSSLIDTLFLSDKRKKLLLLLLEGSQTSDDIKEKLDVNWGAMIPQIKKMQEWNLLKTEDRVYSLTPMGYSIAVNSKRLLNLLDVYGDNYEYLSTHKLTVIPDDLLERIGEINPCCVLESDLAHVFNANEDVCRAMEGSGKCVTLSNFFQPQYNEMYNTLLKGGCDLTFVFSESVWKRVCEAYVYEDGKPTDPNSLDWKKCRVYTIPDGADILEISVFDNGILMGFFDNERRFDTRYILGTGESGCNWATELYHRITDGKLTRIETDVKD